MNDFIIVSHLSFTNSIIRHGRRSMRASYILRLTKLKVKLTALTEHLLWAVCDFTTVIDRCDALMATLGDPQNLK